MAAAPFIMMAVAAASTVAQSIQAGKTADAQAAAQEANNKSLSLAAVEQYNDLSPAERDIMESNNREGLEQQKQYIQSQGRVNLLAGSSGTYGGSVDSMLRDLTQTRGQNMATLQQNRTNQLAEIKTQAEQIRYGARANMTNRVFSKPSIALTAFSAVSSGASAYVGAGGSFGSPTPDAATIPSADGLTT